MKIQQRVIHRILARCFTDENGCLIWTDGRELVPAIAKSAGA